MRTRAPAAIKRGAVTAPPKPLPRITASHMRLASLLPQNREPTDRLTAIDRTMGGDEPTTTGVYGRAISRRGAPVHQGSVRVHPVAYPAARQRVEDADPRRHRGVLRGVRD